MTSLRSGLARIRVSRSTAGPVSDGHPWVFRDGLIDHPAGRALELLDDRDRVLGWGLADEGPIAVRVLGRSAAPDRSLADVVAERVNAADNVRVRMIPTDTDCYRVVGGAGDGLPGLVVDRYGELAVIKIYARAWEVHLDAVVQAVRGLGWVGAILRRFGVARVDGTDGAEVLHGAPPADTLVVREAGMKFLVRPWVGQKTGLFLDQRESRLLVRRLAAGRMVANLFAYNGGFSIAAALGGAARVTTVDIAPDAVDDAREIFALNGIDPADHAFEVADAFAWKPRGALDLLIVDPPSLARQAKSEGAARSAYRKLHRQLGPFVARHGLLATSSCTARLSHEGWQRAVREGLSPTGDWSWHHLSAEPPDHPTALGHGEGRYLKFAILRRR